MRGGDTSQVVGIATSLILHGAILTAVALAPGAWTPPPRASEPGLTVIDIQLVLSDAEAGASAAGPVGEESESHSAVGEATANEPTPAPAPPPSVAGSGSADAPDVSKRSPDANAIADAGRQAGAVDGAPRSNYQSALFAHVLRYRYYPDAARPDRLRGVVRVQFALARDGRIMSAWVQTSSGHQILDDAALDALRRAQPLPPIPPELPDEVEVLLPLDYLPPKVILAG